MNLNSYPALEEHLYLHGWGLDWTDGVSGYHHYHNTAHELLFICDSEVEVKFGGTPGKTLILHPADAVAIPAGVAHRRAHLEGALKVFGAYPAGQRPDLLYGEQLSGQRSFLWTRWTADWIMARNALKTSGYL
ncbi:MAG: hypothetical protein GF398_03020 [Chitinivibrionales bacterium]|nr:hypothetical protein [Chitinivibrionales bacterium]